METVIVTMTDEKESFFFDLEVPIGLPVSKLKDDIVQTLNGYRPELCLSSTGMAIMNRRGERVLQEEETLEQAGVWNGDYLTLICRRKW